MNDMMGLISELKKLKSKLKSLLIFDLTEFLLSC